MGIHPFNPEHRVSAETEFGYVSCGSAAARLWPADCRKEHKAALEGGNSEGTAARLPGGSELHPQV